MHFTPFYPHDRTESKSQPQRGKLRLGGIPADGRWGVPTGAGTGEVLLSHGWEYRTGHRVEREALRPSLRQLPLVPETLLPEALGYRHPGPAKALNRGAWAPATGLKQRLGGHVTSGK